MAQSASMGPPISPRETRRSGRRSAPSASTSTSQSPPPESTSQPNTKPRRQSLPSSNGANGRNRRLKQEDTEDSINGHKSALSTTSSTRPTHPNGRNKRRGKEKEKQPNTSDLVPDSSVPKAKPSVSSEEPPLETPEDDDQGITRCVCGSTEDDPDAGEFMVQCETCKVWQHGLCMGYESEDQLHDGDYYCEQCRPELHQDLLKKLPKKARHSSTNSHNPISSRLSRSHSPSYLAKPSKRRNTMNSRDAAFDESLKEIIEATAAEAAAAQDSRSIVSNANTNQPEPKEEVGPSNRRKRKRRGGDDSVSKKRARSASTTSDHPAGPPSARGETPVTVGGSKPTPASAPAPKSQTTRNRRGARKHIVHEPLPPAEGEEPTQATLLAKRQVPGSRAKPALTSKRALPTSASHAPGSTAHEHGTRRNYSNGANGTSSTTHAATSSESSRAYRNSHAYAVSQQPLFTSWNLPDYLAHLEPMLPTEIPRPLEVCGSGVPLAGAEVVERTTERGVKVKWPSKRTSVLDMNKRVRTLVEWVGREQASAMDRGRRREALERAYKETAREREASVVRSGGLGEENEPGDPKSHPLTGSARDAAVLESSRQENDSSSDPTHALALTTTAAAAVTDVEGGFSDSALRLSNMMSMEALMEELISFQERFGPGAKTRERERRLASAT